jgi:hypothetical protein
MRRFVPALACVLAIPAFALAYPPATVTDITQTSVKIGGLDCGTRYRIRIEERNAADTAWESSTIQTPTTAACAPPPPPPPTCPVGQFQATYFANQTLTAPSSLVRCEANADTDWGTGSPPGLPVDNFSARYEGKVNFDAADYRFELGGDDGVRLYIDGTRLIDQWVDQGFTSYSHTRAMIAGLHDVRVEFYENAGLARVRLAITKQTAQPPPPPPPASCTNPPCFDFVGNSFSGQNFNHVNGSGQDLAVASDGVSVNGVHWEESAHDLRAMTANGDPVGPRPGSTAGRFREAGGGPRAVEVTTSFIYATNSRRVVRWDRSAFINASHRGATMTGTTLTIPGTGELFGITACGGRVFVSDPGASADQESPAGATVKAVADLWGGVLNSWSVPRARHLTCDRQGNVWALQQRVGGTPARLSRWTPTGASLGGFDLSGEPMDIAADPTSDEVLIVDNGLDQRVERYSYTGTQVGTLGESYLNGPTPGLLGPTRFAGPRGVDVDAQRNVYVMQSFNPQRGTVGWADEELGDTMMVSKHLPDGTRMWNRYGMIGYTGMPSPDGARYYANNMTFRLENGRYVPHAYHLDPAVSDPRNTGTPWNHNFGATTVLIREMNGRRYLLKMDRANDALKIFRFDGDLTHHLTTFSAPCGCGDWWWAPNRDIWQTNGSVIRRPFAGLNGNGDPTWGAPQTLPMPPNFNSVRHIEVHGQSVYVFGFGPGAGRDSPFTWQVSGRRLARFNQLPIGGWGNPVWQTDVFYGGAGSHDQPVSFSTDGDKVAVAYLGGGINDQGRYRFYDAASGAFHSLVDIPLTMGPMSGWHDMMRSVNLVNGRLYATGGGQDKAVLVDLG